MNTHKAETVRRKNFNLSQSLIDRARAALGAETETETIERALDTVIDLAAFRNETHDALVRLAGRGGVENYFDPAVVMASVTDGAAVRRPAPGRRKRSA